jgi:opacity protein-like surface antigen
MRRFLLAAVCSVGLAVAAPAAAWATVSPTTGQPGAPANTCGPDNPVTPGASASAPGSPFNASGQAGLVYAGNPDTASLAHANSTVAVSQYDVACVQLSH